MSEPLLRLEDLQTHFFTDDAVVRAVDGVSYELRERETLAVVGESGSGKSVTALSILGLVPQPPGRIVGGSMRFRGRELRGMPISELRKIRGKEISMIFQEPMTSLNPVYSCGEQIMEALMLHEGLDRKAARQRAIEMLQLVGIPLPEQRVDEYPHQMSGGMRQRVMIAMALACRPAILIADEPTTALDVTIQAQILELLERLQRDLGMAVLLITHDLGVVAETADRVAVMYAGQVVEYCDVNEAFERTLHPYTAGLLASLPKLGIKQETLRVIPGNVPNPAHFPPGCRFHPRCPIAIDRCRTEMPVLRDFGSGHTSRCWRAEEIAAGTVDPAGPVSDAAGGARG
ncbi:MAG: ABC transporter ATP-binding protein [Candidatus Eisenbacteria bacterium]|uniref:ABC transporter ATP-binding protein n=1 Tax=Eiseniibacteriota bacterium TaxID=2212470 RepID=A0A849T383_UNCEI|nr:ABC transporter ATP-binding protein [Candidatus Eisenbacteria bacterium]